MRRVSKEKEVKEISKASLIILVVILICVSCSKFKIIKEYDNVDPEFDSYVEEFAQVSDGKYSPERLNSLTIGFTSKFEEEVYAVCNQAFNVNEIDVNRNWWKSASYQDRYQVMMHEMGHCVLQRQHSDFPGGSIVHELEKLCNSIGLFKSVPELLDYCPGSLMSADMVSTFCLQKHDKYYINELFLKEGYQGYSFYPKELYKP